MPHILVTAPELVRQSGVELLGGRELRRAVSREVHHVLALLYVEETQCMTDLVREDRM